jgi:prevent-host-death family protein
MVDLTKLVRRVKMARTARSTADRRSESSRPGGSWRLEQAKARFSEVVRLARESGPQRVTVHGRDAVVIVSAEDFSRLSPAGAAPSLAALFGTGPFARLEGFEKSLVRERSRVRGAVKF